MADNRRVSGEITVEQDSKERVAYDLMTRISNLEDIDQSAPRQYFLELYYQCLGVVHFNAPPEDLKERPRR